MPCVLPLRTLAPWPRTIPPTAYEPNDHFITEAYVEHTHESMSEQRLPDDFDYDDVTIGKTLLDACRRRADHSEECLSSCLSSSVSHDRTERPVVCSLVSSALETQRHNSENEQIRTLLERQREQILADCQAEIRKHEFQADYDRSSIQKLNETIQSQKEEICRAHQGDERRRLDQQLLHEQLLKHNWDLREAHEKSLNETGELKRFQDSSFDEFSRSRLIEDRDTILELTGKIQELQNESNCMNDLRDFQDAESVRSGHSHVASQRVSFPPHPVPGGMLSRSIGMPSRKKWAAKHLGHTWYIGKRFCRSSRVFFSTLSAGSESMEFSYIRTNSLITGQKHQFRISDASLDSQPKIQSSSVEEILQRIMGQTNNDCRSQIFISINSPRQ